MLLPPLRLVSVTIKFNCVVSIKIGQSAGSGVYNLKHGHLVRLGHIYQANPMFPCYNYYVCICRA